MSTCCITVHYNYSVAMDAASVVLGKLQACEYPQQWQLREKLSISDQNAVDMLWKQLNEDSVLEQQLPFML